MECVASITVSAHPRRIRTLEHIHLNRIVIEHRAPLNLQHQYLPDIVPTRHRPLVRHVLLQLEVDEERPVCLTVHEGLCDDVVWLARKGLVGDGLDLEGETEIAEVLERNRRHADLVLLGRDLDHRGALVGLEEVLDARDLWQFALGSDGEAHRLQALELHLQHPLDHIVRLDGRNLDRHLDLRPLLLPNPKPHLLKILKPLIAPHREDILIQVVELLIATLRNHPQHERVRAVIVNDLVFEADRHIDLFDRTREEGRPAELDVALADLDEVFCLGELGRLGLGVLLGRLGRVGKGEVLHHFFDGGRRGGRGRCLGGGGVVGGGRSGLGLVVGTHEVKNPQILV